MRWCFTNPQTASALLLGEVLSCGRRIDFYPAGHYWQNGLLTLCSINDASLHRDVITNARQSYISSGQAADAQAETVSYMLLSRILASGAATERMETSKVISLPLSGWLNLLHRVVIDRLTTPGSSPSGA